MSTPVDVAKLKATFKAANCPGIVSIIEYLEIEELEKGLTSFSMIIDPEGVTDGEFPLPQPGEPSAN